MSGAWFETVEQREVYRGFSNVRLDTIRTPDGATVEREVVEHDEAVAVVPMTEDGQVLLLRQYRQPVGRYLLEIPAGTLDVDGESVTEAARRELAEELHVEVQRLEPLTVFLNSAGWCTERTHVLLGHPTAPVPAPDGFVADAEEAHMEVVSFPLDLAIESVVDGTITDAKSVIGLLLAERSLRG